MKTPVPWILPLFFSAFLLACSASPYRNIHPLSRKTEYSTPISLALLPSVSTLTLHQPRVLANALKQTATHLRNDLAGSLDSLLLLQVPAKYIANKVSLRDSLTWSGSRSTHEGIYFRVDWPAQGKKVGTSDLLLILHEVHVGADLELSKLYDARFTSQGVTYQKKKLPQELKAVISYTLWDNRRMDWSDFGAVEAALPYPTTLTRVALDDVLKAVFEKLFRRFVQGN